MPPNTDQPPRHQGHDSLPPVVATPTPSPLQAPSGIQVLKKPFYKRGWFAVLITIVIILLVAGLGAAAWYKQALKPVSGSADVEAAQVTIEPGSTPDVIAKQLEEAGVIRSSTAFLVHTRLEGVRGNLQAGSYRLSPAESTPDIVGHLIKGQSGEFTVTFYPGSALYINAYESDQTPSHREVLEKLGYSRSEIKAAFEANYDHPLLQGKPAGTTVEGYIYGETYQMASGASVQDILTRTFDEMYSAIEKNNLIQAFESRGMTLYEAITLASIIEREVHGFEDQRQVAQVFYKRLKDGMPLGADATFVYAARMDGRAPTVDYESPYNTRVNRGLPPGPIASPGLSALKAVANPASGDYLYFVSGDDGKNYFSRTLDEHERNTARHCRANCSLF